MTVAIKRGSKRLTIHRVQAKGFLNQYASAVAVIALMAAGTATEYMLGRHLWGISGTPGFWSGDIHSSHNSQFLLDPYTLTHVTHGILFFILLSLVLKHLPVNTRLIIAVGLEIGWEVLENT